VAQGLKQLLRREAAAFDLAFLVTLGLGGGVILYFGSPDEPGLVAPLALASLAGLSAFLLRAHRPTFALVLSVACLACGFAAARVRTILVAAPVLARPMTALVSGVVLSVDPKATGGARLLVKPAEIAGLDGSLTPGLIRLTARSATDLEPGDSILVKAALKPPSAPVIPGGFDFARSAYFDGIGAIGFTLGKVERPAAPPTVLAWHERFLVALDRSRNELTNRIATVIGGENGAVAASQVTGKRSLIPEEANEALRAAGLYHVVSISGLHMALFAGALFWLIRALLALSMRLALTRPLKTLAAILSLVPAAAYTVFSGAEVATLRSFVMTAIVLIAVALRRTAVTRRNVALAACLVMLTTPEQLMGPSFQMSFAAVAMMVAWYDRPRARRQGRDGGLLERAGASMLTALLALLVTTMIASLATAPFASYHFHRLTLQSLAANLLATPIVSGLIMPLALVALVLEPLGYGSVAWTAMGVAVGWFMSIARLVASWPGADLIVPQVPAASLGALSLAVILLALLRTKLAFIAALPAAIGLALMAGAERPVAVVGANGYAALVREGSRIHVIATSQDSFAVREWLLAMGERAPPDAPAIRSGVSCDKEGCSAPLSPPLASGARLFLDRTANAVEEDCGRVAILVSPLRVPDRCRTDGHLVLDRAALVQAGSIALHLLSPEEAGSHSAPRWRIVTAREPGLVRPWTGPAARAAVVPWSADKRAQATEALPRVSEAPPDAAAVEARERLIDAPPIDPAEDLP
jgi:competence protein ComEC